MTQSPTWFVQWFDSPYFHKLYFNSENPQIEEFIKNLIQVMGIPPGAKLLDSACGRGKFTELLASNGFEVTGVDISPESIAIALQNESPTQHYYLHDLRLPFWINYFDAAFNLFTSFGFFKTEREHYNAIRTIGQSLKVGGRFVIDYLNVHYAENNLVFKSEKEIDGIGFRITKWMDETHFYKKVVVEDEAVGEPLEFVETIAKYNLGDFNDMLAFHGFQVQQVFGDYSLGTYDVYKSPRLIIIAEKYK